ncbi:hypothetical protein AXG93_1104s1100 [Marchantia polymorpha subsp. ruderalis]|uniref:Uncharacterized protein n=1 Tax=Marchantia polymorpha subsp. ruderalis TaxID=1480154 RepID=A0A176WM27_MARPO|nr:hypothetical protein AXG93_1104s1100 [Marchantia polymorpha subsp. ruderalis]
MGKRNPNRALQERRNPRVDRSRYLANIRERNSSAAFRTSKKAVDGSEGNTSANEMVTGIDPVKQGVQSEERGASRTRNERKAPESRTEKKARTPLSKATLETSDPSLIESQEKPASCIPRQLYTAKCFVEIDHEFAADKLFFQLIFRKSSLKRYRADLLAGSETLGAFFRRFS